MGQKKIWMNKNQFSVLLKQDIKQFIENINCLIDNAPKSISKDARLHTLHVHMEELAKSIIYHGYLQIFGSADNRIINRKVYVNAVEFYYHEYCISDGIEESKRIEDYIMYHISDCNTPEELKANRTKAQKESDEWCLSPVPVGTLNAHQSGIDITLEDYSKDRFRASVLIREYIVVENDNYENARIDNRSTVLYEELLSGMNIFSIFHPIQIQWIDANLKHVGELESKKRVGAKIVDIDVTTKKRIKTKTDDNRQWRFVRRGGLSAFKKQYMFDSK